MPGKKVLRTGVGIFLLLTLGLAGALFCADLTFYRALFNRGVTDFNTDNYDRAVPELRIAAFGFVDSLPDFEGAQIYLALANDKLARADDARKATLRVADAERIAPSYSGLALPDAVRSQFELLAQKYLSPEQLVLLHRPAAAFQQATVPAVSTNPPETVTQPASTATTVPTTTAATAAPLPVTATEPIPPVTASATSPPDTATAPPAPPVTASSSPTPLSSTEEQERIAAQERAEAQRAADRRAPLERELARRAEQERAAALKAEQDRIAAARKAEEDRAAAQKLATLKAEQDRQAALQAEIGRVAAARKSEEQRTAAERAERERAAERQRAAAAQQIEQQRLAAERERRLEEERRRIEARTTPATGGGTATLRQAEAALQRGDFEAAHAAYLAQLDAQDRDTLLRAGSGLYRLGDFRGAVRAFGKVGALRSGEEIFRYYAAVSLYETGQYAAAKKQLACALPYIETTPETARYQTKIEGAID
jgi:hypothetical protein